jgi:putative ABC transport system permease protein
MKSLPLILAALRRKPARTFLTMLGVVIAFLLFGLLQGVNSAFSVTLGRMKLDRLFVDSRFSQPMPLAYRERIEKVPGVLRVTQISFLRAYYQERQNNAFVIATNPDIWLDMRPEYTIPRAQIEAVVKTRNGVIITDWMARRHGWKIGDQFTVRSRPNMMNVSSDWSFVVAGVMTYVDPTEELTLMLANFSYYDEARSTDRGTADRFLVRTNDPLRSARISLQIDALFATAGVPTRTQTEQEMGQSQVASIGDVRSFTRSIMGAVFFTLLILTGNTMMESVRERTAELAVLKALGFTNSTVLVLVITESVVLCVVASLVGLALAAVCFPLASGYSEIKVLPPMVVLMGVFVAGGVALVSAAFPAWRAVRLSVVDALARR